MYVGGSKTESKMRYIYHSELRNGMWHRASKRRRAIYKAVKKVVY